MGDSRRSGGPDLKRRTRLARLRCLGCDRPVGLVWFGAGPDLVELVPSPVVDARGRDRMALLIHRCDAASPAAAPPGSPTGAASVGPCPSRRRTDATRPR